MNEDMDAIASLGAVAFHSFTSPPSLPPIISIPISLTPHTASPKPSLITSPPVSPPKRTGNAPGATANASVYPHAGAPTSSNWATIPFLALAGSTTTPQLSRSVTRTRTTRAMMTMCSYRPNGLCFEAWDSWKKCWLITRQPLAPNAIGGGRR